MSTALEIVQEAARRLGIMPPNTLFPSAAEIADYDANMLKSFLEATIRQQVSNNPTFFQTKLASATIEPPRDVIPATLNAFSLGNLATIEPSACYDFILRINQVSPDFLKVISGTFKVLTLGTGQDAGKVDREYTFKSLQSLDFLTLSGAYLADGQEDIPTDALAEVRAWQQSSPSKDVTQVMRAQNKESGFFFFRNSQTSVVNVYFINNLIPFSQLFVSGSTEGTWTANNRLSYVYVSKSMTPGEAQDSLSIKADQDSLLIDDEIAVLGAIIGFKGYYGIDYTLELGQQKALLESQKKNVENTTVTRLDNKTYRG
jgi:hypothetical protein